MMNIWMVILFLIFYLIYVLLLGWMARFLNDEVNECTNMSVFFLLLALYHLSVLISGTAAPPI